MGSIHWRAHHRSGGGVEMEQLSNAQLDALWNAQTRNEHGWCRKRLADPRGADDELSVETLCAPGSLQRELKIHHQWVAPYSDTHNDPTSSMEEFISSRPTTDDAWGDWQPT